MKSFALYLAPLLLTIFSTLPASAQDSYGIRLGYTPSTSLNNDHVIINGTGTDLTFNTEKANMGIYAGAYYRRALKDGFFLQGEALYSYKSSDYRINYLDNDAPDSEIQEVTHHLSVPASIGIQFGAVEVLSGFTTYVLLARKSEFSELSAYSENIPPLSFAWHSGIGLTVQQLKFELRYQMDFSNFGTDMYLYDQPLQLTNANNRIVFGISYGF